MSSIKLLSPNIGDYLKNLADGELKDLVNILNLQKKLCFNICEERDNRKAVELLLIFLKTHDEVKKYTETMLKVLPVIAYMAVILRI